MLPPLLALWVAGVGSVLPTPGAWAERNARAGLASVAHAAPAALGDRLVQACNVFEAELTVPPESFDLTATLMRFDDALIDLAWELERGAAGESIARGAPLHHELALARARLMEVADVSAELAALVRLQLRMRAELAAGHPARALTEYAARVPEPLEPLDWPSVARRRIRDLEHELEAARSKREAPGSLPLGLAPATPRTPRPR